MQARAPSLDSACDASEVKRRTSRRTRARHMRAHEKRASCAHRAHAHPNEPRNTRNARAHKQRRLALPPAMHNGLELQRAPRSPLSSGHSLWHPQQAMARRRRSWAHCWGGQWSGRRSCGGGPSLEGRGPVAWLGRPHNQTDPQGRHRHPKPVSSVPKGCKALRRCRRRSTERLRTSARRATNQLLPAPQKRPSNTF